MFFPTSVSVPDCNRIRGLTTLTTPIRPLPNPRRCITTARYLWAGVLVVVVLLLLLLLLLLPAAAPARRGLRLVSVPARLLLLLLLLLTL